MSSIQITEEPPSSPQQTPSSPRRNHLHIYRQNRERLYPDVTDEQWNDWKWQQKNRVTTLDEITQLFGAAGHTDTQKLEQVFELYRTAITPYYLCLIDFDDPH